MHSHRGGGAIVVVNLSLTLCMVANARALKICSTTICVFLPVYRAGFFFLFCLYIWCHICSKELCRALSPFPHQQKKSIFNFFSWRAFSIYISLSINKRTINVKIMVKSSPSSYKYSGGCARSAIYYFPFQPNILFVKCETFAILCVYEAHLSFACLRDKLYNT